MDEDGEGLVLDEDDEPLVARPWSWFWLADSFATFVAVFFRNVGNFIEEGFSVQFSRMHNLKLERDDQRDVARDVLSDIERL